MSTIVEIVKKLDEYVFDDTIPLDEIGTRIVHDVYLDEYFDDLVMEHPELGDFMDYGSDMEWQHSFWATECLFRVRDLLTELKKKVADEI